MTIPAIKMPAHVAMIINILESNGYEAFAVGGCVRDAIMGRTPHDWDITTSAKPEEIKALFHRTIDTGIKHGTITVMISGVGYEVTTYRIDGEYTDGRHPNEVTFTNNLIEDLKRRDFTINAMAYNDRAGIVDAFDGIADIENKTIRCVRVATERFAEDALRILRALRFSAQLDFSISEDTCEAIKSLGANLKLISKERIQTELDKLITSNNPDRIILIAKYNLGSFIFEDASSLTNDSDTFTKIISVMNLLPADHHLRWSALMLFENDPGHVLKKLKFDNKTIDISSRLIKAINFPIPNSKTKLRHMIVKFGKDLFDSYLFTFIDAVSHAGFYTAGTAAEIVHLKSMYDEIVSAGDCLSVKDMAITGKDLISEGFEPGKTLGEIINYLFDLVLNNPSLNDYETLLTFAKNYRN